MSLLSNTSIKRLLQYLFILFIAFSLNGCFSLSSLSSTVNSWFSSEKVKSQKVNYSKEITLKNKEKKKAKKKEYAVEKSEENLLIKHYYTSGEVKYKLSFKNNMLNGTSRHYLKDGKIYYALTFKNDVFVEGFKQGKPTKISKQEIQKFLLLKNRSFFQSDKEAKF